ncbi:uracil-DNA glycosylase [uncultured Sphingomonas sp.]|uniref:uracil-DNA glycosylase n=1 Tax=uncultured Sphingomonas sp. TaxID=158754 RepID=UPI0030F525DD
MAALTRFLAAEEQAGTTIFPPAADRLRALELTALPDVRVVILGQDPYHGAGQAHGLCFSVRPGVKPPPSLANIYRELATDCGITPPTHGFLEHWARQGVLLLNTVLTVAEGRAAAHRGRGWEQLTDAIIRTVAEQAAPTVFMLWGSHAQAKAPLVAASGGDRHLILTAPHPSPLSAYKGWFGSGHFSKANAFLDAHGRGTIDWSVPPLALS